MTIKKLCTSSLIAVLSFAMVEVTFSLNAHAGMIPTSVAVSDMSRVQNLEKVNSALARPDVQAELMKRGVAPSEAAMRVASLSDFELQTLAGNVDNTPAGGDVIVISLTTILLVVIILLLIGKL